MLAPSASPKINLRAIYLISSLSKTSRFLQEFQAKFDLISLNVRITVRKLFSLLPKEKLSAEFTLGLSKSYYYFLHRLCVNRSVSARL